MLAAQHRRLHHQLPQADPLLEAAQHSPLRPESESVGPRREIHQVYALAADASVQPIHASLRTGEEG